MSLASVRALTFDVFGTVVDWRRSVAAAGEALGRRKGITADWTAFADAWRAGYKPAMDRVRRGERPWAHLDVLHREQIDGLLARFGIAGLGEADKDELNRAWHHLDPWPDSIPGLMRLKRKYVISTLTNGTVSGMIAMAKRAGLPWDCVLTAENVRHYKPDPEVYRMAVELLGPRPEQVMMVAAHNSDLKHARSHGMATAFVARPQEYGPRQAADVRAEEEWDVVATDFLDLVSKLGA